MAANDNGDARRQLVRDYHHGKINETDWQARVAADPSLKDLHAAMLRQFPGKEG
jgi:hypothetical protein